MKKWPCRHGMRKGRKLTPEKVVAQQLRAGIRVEQEHTTSKRTACRIALDHLAEHRHYYAKLRKAGL